MVPKLSNLFEGVEIKNAYDKWNVNYRYWIFYQLSWARLDF